jgi:hypothetical protein
MSSGTSEKKSQTVYVKGSGLVPVPVSQINEVPKIIAEHHANEVERLMRLAKYRKMA